MKKMLALIVVFTIIAIAIPAMATEKITEGIFAGCELTNRPERPSNLGEADIPPDGAVFSIVDNGNKTRTVIFKDFPELFKNSVELYGRKGVYICPLQNGKRTYPKGMWLNTDFLYGRNYHYILATDEYQVAPQPYMGPGVCIMPNHGHGAAFIFCGDLRKQQ